MWPVISRPQLAGYACPLTVGFHAELNRLNLPNGKGKPSLLDYYFDVFLQSKQKLSTGEYMKEIELYNRLIHEEGNYGEARFFKEVAKKYPEMSEAYHKYMKERREPVLDIMQYLMDHSEFLNKNDNQWMKEVMQVIRGTSLFFQPQIRTKIMNEGWASYWHQYLFLKDDRIGGHEVDYSRVNAYVTSLPRVGLNPYALGMRLFEYLEEIADKGCLSLEFQRIQDITKRKDYQRPTMKGKEFIFQVRENFCDFTFINQFIDQDFVNRHQLFVSGKRLNRQRRTWEYYVKSRRISDCKQMLINSLYHPPVIQVDEVKGQEGNLYLNHVFEGKPLVSDFIAGTMLGIEYLWGTPVQLETSEVAPPPPELIESPFMPHSTTEPPETEIRWQRVLYTMHDKKLDRMVLE